MSPRAKTTPAKPKKKTTAKASPPPRASEEASFSYDAQALAENMAKVSDLWQRVMQKLGQSNMIADQVGHTDPMSFASSLLSSMRQAQVNPNSVMESGLKLASEHAHLLHSITSKILGRGAAPYVEEAGRDKRFRDDAWSQNPWFDYIRQSYLLNTRWALNSVNDIEGISPRDRHKLTFFTRQWLDALSPSNFALTNPQVLRATFDSNGENLVKGLSKLLKDLEKGEGKLLISTSDESAFTLGKNIAASKGSIVYQNALMQLIEFAPTTKQVFETPMLLVPAWINKYYILDLAPGNSLVEWLTSQGMRVFVISWVNPDQKLSMKGFEDYLKEGPLSALNVIEEITGQKKTHMLGYCLGGTLTAITLAYLRARGEDKRVASATYLTTLIDFTEAGDLSVFIDDAQLESLENRMNSRGFLDAADMATTFSMLRANDMIWSFVINNYLLGKEPLPFDMLYWNADATRMPAAMHAYYLRKMYKENALIRPGGIELLGTAMNVTKITTPSYLLATRDDHIAPWKATYAATQLYDGPVHFTLADSGHVAGVINSPSRGKYCYWRNKSLPSKPDAWLENATQHSGSWWPDHMNFLTPLSGKKIAAPKAQGSSKHKPIEAAPGAYAKLRAR